MINMYKIINRARVMKELNNQYHSESVQKQAVNDFNQYVKENREQIFRIWRIRDMCNTGSGINFIFTLLKQSNTKEYKQHDNRYRYSIVHDDNLNLLSVKDIVIDNSAYVPSSTLGCVANYYRLVNRVMDYYKILNNHVFDLRVRHLNDSLLIVNDTCQKVIAGNPVDDIEYVLTNYPYFTVNEEMLSFDMKLWETQPVNMERQHKTDYYKRIVKILIEAGFNFTAKNGNIYRTKCAISEDNYIVICPDTRDSLGVCVRLSFFQPRIIINSNTVERNKELFNTTFKDVITREQLEVLNIIFDDMLDTYLN